MDRLTLRTTPDNLTDNISDSRNSGSGQTGHPPFRGESVVRPFCPAHLPLRMEG